TMVALFCKKQHHSSPLCDECEEIYIYATGRMANCPLLESSLFCSSCHIHCYDEEHREAIRKIMKYSGKRMLLYHPVMALKHVVQSLRKRGK
ncbi:MAG: nitrous oxide-stimulated promoter family protein, partial [Spirochaetia bacterium]|nr:nitrous oxide-stimulated promoter family protein [Spirochaetia bacterium]